MDVKELKSSIISNTVPSFLVFTGSEWAVQKIYIDQILQRNKLIKRYMDSVYDIIPKLGNKTFITNQSYLYIVRDDAKFVADTKIWDKVIKLLGNNVLILLITKPDKRLKFYNTYKSALIEFSALKPEILKKYIQKEIALSDKNTDKLIEVCEGNYGRILLEIDKIKMYAGTKLLLDDSFELLLADGTIYREPKDAIFDFVNAILDRKPIKAYQLYQDCLAINESTLAILTNLFNNAKAVLQVQTCTSKDVSKATGLTGWQIMNARQHLDVYNNNELMRMLKLIQRCELAFKTGTIAENFIIDYILVRVL